MPDSGRGAFVERSLSQDDAGGFRGLNGALWCPSEDVAPPPELRDDLARTIAAEIIPWLMLAHRATVGARPAPKTRELTPLIVTDQDVARLAEMIVHQPATRPASISTPCAPAACPRKPSSPACSRRRRAISG